MERYKVICSSKMTAQMFMDNDKNYLDKNGIKYSTAEEENCSQIMLSYIPISIFYTYSTGVQVKDAIQIASVKAINLRR